MLDESLITGEAAAVTRRHAGELIRGGSVNLGAALVWSRRRLWRNPRSRRSSRCSSARRPNARQSRRAADRVASWFVCPILVLAALTAVAWWLDRSAQVFPAVLAVLVVTCPCALSLATPAALAAATLRLSRLGLLVTRADALERLARVDTVVLDKTGTLTADGSRINGGQTTAEPVARRRSGDRRARWSATYTSARIGIPRRRGCGAGRRRAGDSPAPASKETVDGRCWRLGRRDFVDAIGRRKQPAAARARRDADRAVYLGSAAGLVARIRSGTPLRPEARDAIRRCGGGAAKSSSPAATAKQPCDRWRAARGATIARARLSPPTRSAMVAGTAGRGQRVFMIGDGINDGPVLAAADVSCAMGQGSAIAQSAADLLLLHEILASLPAAIAPRARTLRVMRQNLGWALGYNIAAVPLAAFGLMPPWLAALGHVAVFARGGAQCAAPGQHTGIP